MSLASRIGSNIIRIAFEGALATLSELYEAGAEGKLRVGGIP